jgi:hypothetical protein
VPLKFGTHVDAHDKEQFHTVLPVRASDKVFIEQASLWDGLEPENHWKRKRRDIVQWRSDQLAPAEMLGTMMFRATSVNARTVAERITDEQLRLPNVVETFLACFDSVYAAFMTTEDDKTFDNVFDAEVRKSNEPTVPWVSRKLDCFLKCESRGGVLPMHTKGKLMLRHANLGTHQEAKVITWLEGKRDLDTVIGKLKQLDVEDLQWHQNRKSFGAHFNTAGAPQNYPVMANGADELWPQHSYPTMSTDLVQSQSEDSSETFLVDEETPQAVSAAGDWEFMLYHEDPIDEEICNDEGLDEGICSQYEEYFWLRGARLQNNWTEP